MTITKKRYWVCNPMACTSETVEFLRKEILSEDFL